MSEEREGPDGGPTRRPPEVATPPDGGGLSVIGEEIPPPSEVNDTIVGVCAVVAALGGLVFAVGLLLDAPVAVHGGGLAVGLLSLAIAVRRYFAAAYPDIEALEEREIPGREAEGPVSEVRPVGRRSFLQRLLVACAAIFGVAVVAPPVASLGPAPGDTLRRTRWEAGTRLVTTDGEPIRPEDVAVGGISTVWPEGAIGEESSSVILVRLSDPRGAQRPTNLEWTVDDQVVAYSKVCTHAGCPVALFRERDDALFCPCHQSTFDAARGAVPTFGPTARALPQLPMGVDDDGYLVALGDFTEQVGPAFG